MQKRLYAKTPLCKNASFVKYVNPLSAGVFLKIVPILPKFIKTSNDTITRRRPIWTLVSCVDKHLLKISHKQISMGEFHLAESITQNLS